MREEKVDLIIGSHDSATREGNIATIKGRSPTSTRRLRGGDALRTSTASARRRRAGAAPVESSPGEGAKSFYLIGDDYSAAQSNEQIKKFVAQTEAGRRRRVRAVRRTQHVRGGGDSDQGASRRRRRDAGWRRQRQLQPHFAGFGLDKSIVRCRCCSRNTLLGVGGEQREPVLCMASSRTARRMGKAFKAEYLAKYGAKAPQLATIGADCYSALTSPSDFRQGRRWRREEADRRSEGLSFDAANARVTMRGRQVDKDMYLASCKAPSSRSSRPSRR